MARRGSAATFGLPEPRAAARRFERAAETFADASFVHDETRAQLLERLDFVRIPDDGLLVDLGAGPGTGALALATRYPRARVLALDRSPAMLRLARTAGLAAVAGDAERLPLRDAGIALVFANLVLPWCSPAAFFAEVARVLSPDGALVFATLGPDTLGEIRRAFGADPAIHVHGLFDMHDLGDLALAAGLEEPVLSAENMTVTYPNLAAIVRDLRACGATNVAAGRRSTLTGARRWQAFEQALEASRREGRLALTVEVVYGQAFGRSRRRVPQERGEIAVPLSEIRRRHDDRR